MSKKSIVLGITGGIAAYKCVELAGILTKKGFDVHVILTDEAKKFVAPLSLEVATKNKVWTDQNCLDLNPIPHIHLAEIADLFVIAPVSANTLAKAANGFADNLLSSALLAYPGKVLYVPSMNTNMLENPATESNIETLRERGHIVMEPDTGMLACGIMGRGKHPSNERIIGEIENILFGDTALEGLSVLITAGGTIEPLDPVRYISNRSSGKMGAALAKEAKRRGASVTLVLGNHELKELPDVKIINVETAEEMYNKVMFLADEQDIIIKAAAVADYKPQEVAKEKIKKEDNFLTLSLEKTKDILKDLGLKKKSQIIVGFAAETENIEENALKKLKEKHVDMIIANDVSREDSGIGKDTNLATIYTADGGRKKFDLLPKEELAKEIFAEIIKLPNFGTIAK